MSVLDRVLACVIALLLAVPLPVWAQSAAPNAPAAANAPSPPPFTPEQLDQIVAPVALYPDPLLAQILMAATYPLEVVQAARYLKDNPNLTGDQLDAALKSQSWDDSVKSLVTFPQVLTMMDAQLDWTQKLGDAFLASEQDVMNAVQRLRAKAQAQGNLTNTAQQVVTSEPAPPPPPPDPGAPPQQVVVQQAPPTIITIQPANPQVIYVPTYNPTVVYGAWPYPAYPPYAYYPPGYVAGAALFSFAAGVAVGAALWGNCNWRGGSVNVNVNQYNNFSRNVNNVNVANTRTQVQGNRQNWQHNPEHRGGAQYRDQASQQRYNRGNNPQAVQSREAFRGRADQGRQELNRGAADQFRQGGTGTRQTGAQTPQGIGGATGAQRGTASPGGGLGAQQGAARPQQGAAGRPQQGAAGINRGSGQAGAGGSAFQGTGQGKQVQNYSNRGQASRQGMGASSAGSRPSVSAPSGGGRQGGAPAGGASRGGGGASRGGGGVRR